MPHLSRQVVDGLYGYIWQGRGNNCNTYVLTDVLNGMRPHVIVDPGFITNELREPCFESLVAVMQGDRLAVEDIGLVINTHVHPDHCQATEAIVERGNGKGCEGDTGMVITAISFEESDYYNYFKAMSENTFSMFGMKPAKLEPFIYLTGGDLKLENAKGKVDLQVILTPGHSPGSICLYWPDRKTLITGDVVFFGSVGRTDFPGGDTSMLRESIAKLSQLDIEFLFPGHSTDYGSIIEGSELVKRNFQAVNYLF